MPPSIEQLAALARSGDRGAFEAVLEQTLPVVRRFLFRLGAPVHDLDDLTQEVFVTVIEKLDQFRGASRFTTWQMGVAMNVFRASRRRSMGVHSTPGDRACDQDRSGSPDSPDGAPGPARQVSDRDDVAKALTVVACLPDALREVFVLRYIEELPAIEVGQIVGAPEGTVRRRAKEARDQVKAAILGGNLGENLGGKLDGGLGAKLDGDLGGNLSKNEVIA